MLQKIKAWFKARRHKKDYNNLRESLLNNPKLFLENKYRFERAFGVNSRVRTAIQWQRLVNLYGIKKVSETEKMSEEEVRKMMVETYDQKLKRRLKG
ncbi:MAG TPA: hypothetical protein VN722_08445 [Hanamia sp.]|nr:hypothetical protein [Hanamia sp.]